MFYTVQIIPIYFSDYPVTTEILLVSSELIILNILH
jgi:hypothetical protein